MDRPLLVVDVFPSGPWTGNPVAVVAGADGVDDATLQRVASWTNLSETTFLLTPADPGADYRLRIFTTESELPFAGHPTLGSCRAWRTLGGRPRRPGRVVQECGVGLVELREDDDGELRFAAPPLRRSGPVEPALLAEVVTALGVPSTDVVDAAWVDNGPGWLGVLLGSADQVLGLPLPATPVPLGVVGPHPPGGPAAIEVRAFLPQGGTVVEDPVTGSLQASLAQWLTGAGRIGAPYVATQGAAVGRAGVVRVSVDGDGALWVGGRTEVRVTGTVEL